MTRKELSHLLETQIPLSKAMGITVAQCSVKSGVKFSLPLAPNRNHKQTAFGGTLVAAQALAAWAWLTALLGEKGIIAGVVVQRQTGEFLRPVNRDFSVQTRTVPPFQVRRFLHTLELKGKARLPINAQVVCAGKVAATYTGEYVAQIYG